MIEASSFGKGNARCFSGAENVMLTQSLFGKKEISRLFRIRRVEVKKRTEKCSVNILQILAKGGTESQAFISPHEIYIQYSFLNSAAYSSLRRPELPDFVRGRPSGQRCSNEAPRNRTGVACSMEQSASRWITLWVIQPQ